MNFCVTFCNVVFEVRGNAILILKAADREYVSLDCFGPDSVFSFAAGVVIVNVVVSGQFCPQN